MTHEDCLNSQQLVDAILNITCVVSEKNFGGGRTPRGGDSGRSGKDEKSDKSGRTPRSGESGRKNKERENYEPYDRSPDVGKSTGRETLKSNEIISSVAKEPARDHAEPVEYVRNNLLPNAINALVGPSDTDDVSGKRKRGISLSSLQINGLLPEDRGRRRTSSMTNSSNLAIAPGNPKKSGRNSVSPRLTPKSLSPHLSSSQFTETNLVVSIQTSSASESSTIEKK